MRTSAVVGLLSVLALSAGCSSGDDGGKEESAPKPEACSYDSPATLLPALKAAFGDEATVHMDMKMTGGGSDMTMTGDMKLSDAGAEMDLKTTGQQEFAMIVVGDEYYVSQTADDPTYTKLPAEAAAVMKQQLASAEIRSSFAAFDSGLKTVTSQGREELDGEDLCAYTLTVDTKKALEAQGQTAAPAGMPKTLTYDMLLTDDDLMRRMSFELGPIEMVMDMTEWNEPVDIKAPKVD
jgi:hypothetical protein